MGKARPSAESAVGPEHVAWLCRATRWGREIGHVENPAAISVGIHLHTHAALEASVARCSIENNNNNNNLGAMSAIQVKISPTIHR